MTDLVLPKIDKIFPSVTQNLFSITKNEKIPKLDDFEE